MTADWTVARLIIQNIEDEDAELLRLRARQEGVSVGETHRRLLRRMLLDNSADLPLAFKDHLLGMPNTGGDLVVERSKEALRTVDFD